MLDFSAVLIIISKLFLGYLVTFLKEWNRIVMYFLYLLKIDAAFNRSRSPDDHHWSPGLRDIYVALKFSVRFTSQTMAK